MRILQRCEAASSVSVARRCASWLRVDEPIAVIEEFPAIDTVGFDPAAAFVQQSMVGTA